jgi:S-formylglutathione hydrolase FrmB
MGGKSGKGAIVNKLRWLGMILAVVVPMGGVLGSGWRKADNELARSNRQLKGRLIDYTANHGKDNRIWSRSLEQRRDLYVYLPPGYDPHQPYPLMILMHGFALDEQMIFELVPHLDEAIGSGKLPPLIVAAPDGSLIGEPCLLTPGSFFLNSEAGNYEDFVVQDIWDFMIRHYPIRPERDAHVLAGVSMGGFASYSLGIRHRDGFGVVVGINAPLNLRWVDKNQNYFANFDPYNWGWREQFRMHDPVGRFYGGLVTIRVKNMLGPLFGRGEELVQQISTYNPIELVDRTHLQNGELAMYIGYGGEDQFNIDAQVESFLYLCKFRGLDIGVGYIAEGKHDNETAIALLPAVFHWLAPLLAPFSPGVPYVPEEALPPPRPVTSAPQPSSSPFRQVKYQPRSLTPFHHTPRSR